MVARCATFQSWTAVEGEDAEALQEAAADFVKKDETFPIDSSVCCVLNFREASYQYRNDGWDLWPSGVVEFHFDGPLTGEVDREAMWLAFRDKIRSIGAELRALVATRGDGCVQFRSWKEYAPVFSVDMAELEFLDQAGGEELVNPLGLRGGFEMELRN
jgi:hypothetical protein